jgi:hypothetical protein
MRIGGLGTFHLPPVCFLGSEDRKESKIEG